MIQEGILKAKGLGEQLKAVLQQWRLIKPTKLVLQIPTGVQTLLDYLIPLPPQTEVVLIVTL